MVRGGGCIDFTAYICDGYFLSQDILVTEMSHFFFWRITHVHCICVTVLSTGRANRWFTLAPSKFRLGFSKLTSYLDFASIVDYG